MSSSAAVHLNSGAQRRTARLHGRSGSGYWIDAVLTLKSMVLGPNEPVAANSKAVGTGGSSPIVSSTKRSNTYDTVW